jgi:predicted TIM-barrel fold metal-dependent hydrolase
MPTIDADAHVVETDRTWSFLEKEEEPFRPVALTVNDATGQGIMGEVWRVGRRVIPRRVFLTERTGTTTETQELLNIEARLRHMRELGVDVHVLYPTMFLNPVTSDPQVEAALYKTYNRWMAEIWANGHGQLRWAVLAPTLTMDLACSEIRWAKDHGACAVFMRGSEDGKPLSNPHFYPLYEEASRLDLPICVHAGNGSVVLDDLYLKESAQISRSKLPALGAFHDIVLSGLPSKFPALRFGMIETSASWVPYMCHDLKARLARIYDRQVDMETILRDNRIYVACQTDDDLPYVLRYAGEDNLVIGSDYGHNDTSSELEAIRRLRDGGTLPARVIDKILDDNARALYGF